MIKLLDQIFSIENEPYAQGVEETQYVAELLKDATLRRDAQGTYNFRGLTIRHNPATYDLREVYWGDVSQPLGFNYCYWLTKTYTDTKQHMQERKHFFVSRSKLFGAVVLPRQIGTQNVSDSTTTIREQVALQHGITLGALTPTPEDAFACETAICSMIMAQRIALS